MRSITRRWRERVNQGRVIAVLPADIAPETPLAGVTGVSVMGREVPVDAVTISMPENPDSISADQLAALASAALETDLAQLKNISSKERKEEHKRDYLIPRYRDYVERLMGTGHALLAYWLVWLFDAGLVPEALAYARRFFATQQPLPGQFKATPRLFTATQFLEWANAEFAAGRSFEPYFTELFAQILQEPAVWNLPDDTLGGFYRLRGLAAMKQGDLDGAAKDLERALALGQQVTTKLKTVQKAIAKRDAPPA